MVAVNSPKTFTGVLELKGLMMAVDGVNVSLGSGCLPIILNTAKYVLLCYLVVSPSQALSYAVL